MWRVVVVYKHTHHSLGRTTSIKTGAALVYHRSPGQNSVNFSVCVWHGAEPLCHGISLVETFMESWEKTNMIML